MVIKSEKASTQGQRPFRKWRTGILFTRDQLLSFIGGNYLLDELVATG